MTDIELIKQLVPLWYAQYKWATELLETAFDLSKAEDILSLEFRGHKEIPGTNWTYRTHGAGVDICRTTKVGGIDLDFDKPDPDAWRLRIFFERQYNDGNIPLKEYRHLANDEDALVEAIAGALK